ncbi:MAG: patatin-like phospholipase family protein [bacterium]|nr:patatin-like phospholipase family protein [bacterium]
MRSLPKIDNRVFVNELAEIEILLVRLLTDDADWLVAGDESVLRWALSLARVSAVENDEEFKPKVIEIGHATDVYRQQLFNLLKPFIAENKIVDKAGIGGAISSLRTLVINERKELIDLYRQSLSEKSLDDAVRSRPLALALSGGGGTSFVFIGAFTELEKAGIVPSVITGTSMGALLGAYRARNIKFNLDGLINILAALSWDKVAKPLHLASNFGIPATFKLYFREVFGAEFKKDKQFYRISDLEIPFRATVSGVAHIEGQPDPDFESYGHLLDDIEAKVSAFRSKEKGIIRILRDLAAKPLVPIYIGSDALTQDFDVLDAVGFSAAVPGLFHYDIDIENKRMMDLTAKLMQDYGVVRLFDGGFVDNLPALEAKEAIQSGITKVRDPFVLALDGFAPNLHRHWMFLPLMRIAAEHSKVGYKTANLAITYKHVLSPLNLFPSIKELERAVDNGVKETSLHIPFIKKMLGPIPKPAGISKKSLKKASV